MSNSWHDGRQSWQRIQDGQRPYDRKELRLLWGAESKPARLEDTEWEAEWREVGLEKQEGRQMDTLDCHIKGSDYVPLRCPVEMLEHLRSELDLKPLSIICNLLCSSKELQLSKQITIFWVSWSRTGNKIKIIILFMSNLFCSSSSHEENCSGEREGPGKVKRERTRKCGPAPFTKDDGAEEGAGLGVPGAPHRGSLGRTGNAEQVQAGCKMTEVYEIKSKTRLQRRGNWTLLVIRNGVCFYRM